MGSVSNAQTQLWGMADRLLVLYTPHSRKTGHPDTFGFRWYPFFRKSFPQSSEKGMEPISNPADTPILIFPANQHKLWIPNSLPYTQIPQKPKGQIQDSPLSTILIFQLPNHLPCKCFTQQNRQSHWHRRQHARRLQSRLPPHLCIRRKSCHQQQFQIH